MPRPTVFFFVVKNLSIKRNDPISNATQASVLHRTMCSTWTAFVLLRGVCCLSMTIYVVCRLSIFHVGQSNTQHMRQWSMCVSVCVYVCVFAPVPKRSRTLYDPIECSTMQRTWIYSVWPTRFKRHTAVLVDFFSCFVRWASRNQVNNLPTKPTILF